MSNRHIWSRGFLQELAETGPIVPGAEYKHYDGTIVVIEGMGTYTETSETVVVYKEKVEGTTWVRPVSKFTDMVQVEGKSVKRYTKVQQEDYSFLKL